MAPKDLCGQMMEATCPSMTHHWKLSSPVAFDFGRPPNLRLRMASKGDTLDAHMSHTQACMSVSKWTSGSLELQLAPVSSETSQGKHYLHVYLLEVERCGRMRKVLFLTSLSVQFT